MNCNKTSILPQFPKIQTYSTTSATKDPSPGYFLKYLNDPKAISIFSQRIPIPVLSPLESCRGTPMKLINFSPSISKDSQKIIRKLIAKNKTSGFVKIKEKSGHCFERGNSLGHRKLNEIEKNLKTEKKIVLEPFKVHRYARPRLLRAMKRDGFEFDKKIEFSVNVPVFRAGFVGKKKVSGSFIATVKQRSVSPNNFVLRRF